MQENILVLGATGTVGGAVIARLQNESVQVIAAVRDLHKGEFGAEVQRRHLDFADVSTFAPAVAGIDRVFMIAPPFLEDVPGVFRQLVAAIRAAGVQQVVLSTALGANLDPNGSLYQVEEALTGSGVPYTLLRPNFYAQNFITYDAEHTRRGIIFLPAGDGAASYIDVRDIAEAAVAAFQGPAHLGKAYDLTGSEAFTLSQVAALFSDLTGRSFQYLNSSPEEFGTRMASYGLPPIAIATLQGVYTIFREGFAAGVTPDFEALTGKAPRTFESFAAEFIAEGQPV